MVLCFHVFLDCLINVFDGGLPSLDIRREKDTFPLEIVVEVA